MIRQMCGAVMMHVSGRCDNRCQVRVNDGSPLERGIRYLSTRIFFWESIVNSDCQVSVNDGSPPAVFDVHHLCGARSRESVKTKQNKTKSLWKSKLCERCWKLEKCLENVKDQNRFTLLKMFGECWRSKSLHIVENVWRMLKIKIASHCWNCLEIVDQNWLKCWIEVLENKVGWSAGEQSWLKCWRTKLLEVFGKQTAWKPRRTKIAWIAGEQIAWK